jgi:hypothetical protein
LRDLQHGLQRDDDGVLFAAAEVGLLVLGLGGLVGAVGGVQRADKLYI